jgi:hypothetical protein
VGLGDVAEDAAGADRSELLIINNAQPSTNPSSTTPIRTFSLAGMNGAATSATAANSPAATEIATINPILLSIVGCRRPDCFDVAVPGWGNHDRPILMKD